MTLVTWGGATVRNIPIQGITRTCNPMFESTSNGFCPKEEPISIFSHLLIMERSQNWPDVRSPISFFRNIRSIHTGTDINRWKFQGDRSFGVAMTNIQNLSEVRSLDVTCSYLTMSDLGPKFSQSVRKRCMNSCAKNGGAPRRRFPAIGEKPEGGGVQTPPPRPGAG